MFPLTHALVAQKLIKNSRSRVILGGVFPDLANVIGLNRDVTHEMGENFYHFCRVDYEDFIDFAQAVISHGANPPGLDYYADQSYQGQEPGYCFQRGEILVDQVIKACGIPPEMGLWKAHNFIEMAFDVISVKLYPSLPQKFEDALGDRAELEECSCILSKFFQIDQGKIAGAFLRMPEFFCLNDVTPFHLAEKYALQLKKRHGVLTANPEAMSEVIQKAQEIIEGEFLTFINHFYDKVSPLLTKYPRTQRRIEEIR